MKRFLVFAMVLFPLGCPKKPPLTVAPGTPAAAPAPLPAGSGTLDVTVRFKGAVPPARAEIDVSSDAGCAARHAGEPLLDDALVVGADRGIRDVFVWLESSALKAASWPAPSAPAVIDQNGCAYRPHAFTMMARQSLEVRNSDGVTHNVHATPARNEGFNFSQAGGKTDLLTVSSKWKTFVVPEERPFRIKCEVHGWMGAWVAVHRHPFHGVTDEKGRLRLSGIPAGVYSVRVWHERADRGASAWTAERQVTVGENTAETLEVDLGE